MVTYEPYSGGFIHENLFIMIIKQVFPNLCITWTKESFIGKIRVSKQHEEKVHTKEDKDMTPRDSRPHFIIISIQVKYCLAAYIADTQNPEGTPTIIIRFVE